MVIRIEDGAYPFLELLFVREAWHLAVPEVPPIEKSGLIPCVPPPKGMATAELHQDWLGQWRAGWGQYDLQIGAATPPHQKILQAIAATPDTDLDTFFNGRGRQLVEDTERDAFNAWQKSYQDPHGVPLRETPERISLPALVGAWERGLKTIVQLPFKGPYAVSRNDQCLVVSHHTRADPHLFTQALNDH